MKRMKETLKIVILTGSCIVILLGFVLWIIIETFLKISINSEFNWWSVYGLLIAICVIIIGLIASVFILAWKHTKEYERRLKHLQSLKNGGGVNHDKDGFIRKE